MYGPRIEAGINEGQTQEIWLMPPQDVEIISGGWRNPIKGYKLQTNNNLYEFRFEDVAHIRTPNLDYDEGQSLWGMSPLRAGLMTLDRSNSNYEASAKSFKNMGMAGILQVEDEPFAGPLSDEQRRKEEDRLDQDYNGVTNKGKLMVTNQKHTFTKLGLSPVDLDLIMDKKATLRDFCNIYNVSSVLFNDNENSTYNNVLEAKKSAFTEAVLPANQKVIEALELWLLPSYGDNLRIIQDTSDVDVLQADRGELMGWINTGVQSGILTRNEGREFIGLPESDEAMMDAHTVGFSTLPISEVDLDVMTPKPGEEKAIGKHYLDK
jgi:HK97 family phage portal protein